jgi:serine/threonine protein kinase
MSKLFVLFFAFGFFVTDTASAQNHAHTHSACPIHVLEEMIPAERLLGNGVSAMNDATLTHYHNEPAVYLKTNSQNLNPATLKKTSLGLYNKLSRMDVKEAYKTLETFEQKKANFYKLSAQAKINLRGGQMFNETFEETATNAVANNLINFDRLHQASLLTFEGHPILPKPYAFVRNTDHLPVGSIIEYIHGDTLMKAVEQRKLNEAQYKEVFRQIRGELETLHHHGFVHGDINEANIMVDLADSDHPHVRLIDMTYEADSKKNTPAKDWEELQRVADMMGYRENFLPH